MATVLVLEDNPENLELMTCPLKAFGHVPLTAIDGETGIEIARSARPDLILCDIHLPGVRAPGPTRRQILELAGAVVPDLILSDLHMPGEDGFNFIRQIKTNPLLCAIPFMFISSSVWGEKDRDRALQLGVSQFLLRPIEPQLLLDEIQKCLTTHRGGDNGNHTRRR